MTDTTPDYAGLLERMTSPVSMSMYARQTDMNRALLIERDEAASALRTLLERNKELERLNAGLRDEIQFMRNAAKENREAAARVRAEAHIFEDAAVTGLGVMYTTDAGAIRHLAPTVYRVEGVEPHPAPQPSGTVKAQLSPVWLQNLIGFLDGVFPDDAAWRAIWLKQLRALALTAGKPEQVPSVWQPIETAPKDGTKILVYFDAGSDPYYAEDEGKLTPYGAHAEGGDFLDGSGVCVAEWVKGWREPLDEYSSVCMPGWWFAWFNGDTDYVVAPTHWMPLPPPPTAGGGDE